MKREQMVLTIDVGNTNITFGVFEGDEVRATFRMMSQMAHTSDEYGILIVAMLNNNGIEKDEIEGVIIASVVPNVMHALVNSIVKYIGHKPYIVGPGLKTGIKVRTENPKEVGPDLIVDSVAAYEWYGDYLYSGE